MAEHTCPTDDEEKQFCVDKPWSYKMSEAEKHFSPFCGYTDNQWWAIYSQQAHTMTQQQLLAHMWWPVLHITIH